MNEKEVYNSNELDELKIVEKGDLLEVAILLNGIRKITERHLKKTAKHENSSVLSFLLSHPTSKEIKNVNSVFIHLIQHSNMSLIKIMLQFQTISFSARNVDRIVEEIFLTKNTELLLLVLGDKRFKPEETLPYVLYACKCESAVDILEVLFSDTRFVVPKDKICQVFGEAVLDMNLVLYLIDAFPKGYLTSCCVIKAVRSGNTSSFSLLLRQVDNNEYPSIITECFYDANPMCNLRNVDVERIEMFKILINTLSENWIPRIYKLCFVNEDIERLRYVIDSNKLAKDTNLLCLGLFDINQDLDMLNDLIDSYSISLCDSTGCFITFLLRCRYDRIALSTMSKYKNSICCQHTDKFLALATQNGCMKTTCYLLDNTLCNITNKTRDKILSTKNEECISKMLQHGTLDHKLVYKHLENKDFSVVDIIARHYNLELFWKDYALLRLATKDKTSNSYDALYGRYNPYT